MTIELIVLAWGCILALVHVFLAARFKTRQYGLKWNMGARDEELPPPQPVLGRLMRAQANFFETFPIFVAAVLTAVAGQATSHSTALGALLWLGGRLLYLPLYAFGVPVLRTIAWGASIVGIVLVLRPALVAFFA